jgi:NAD(P)-dependent dehydrogenase (short-subunit alcohol dehydrogenase family)
MSRSGRLEGRTFLIVGGTGGIGLATARRFLQEGARVVVAGSGEAELETAIETLTPLGPSWVIDVDVREPVSVDRLFTTAVERLSGRLDVLFHVAGISGRSRGDGALHECRYEAWDAVLDVNAKGVFLTNRAAVRVFLGQDPDDHGIRGSVLNVGSVLARSPSPRLFGTYAYAASKGAISAMTLVAAARYAGDGIRFNLIAPALIDTPMARRAVESQSIRHYLQTKQPIAGGPGAPEDCAEAALYLCEPSSRFVTGVELTVDGGWSISDGQYLSEAP